MIIPNNGVRQPNNAGGGTAAMGPEYVQAKVISIDIEKNIAYCTDSLSRTLSVRLDVQRAKGQMPEEGETWIVDKYYGIWTFAALMNGGTQGVVTAIENVPDLAPTLQAQQAQNDAQADRMAGMQLTMTVTNVPGTHKRYVDGTLADGTAVTFVPCTNAYYPQVGDTAWVLRQGVANDATSTPSLIAIGRAGVVAGAPFGQGNVMRPQVVAESAMWLLADKRQTLATNGTYQITRGQIDANGQLIFNSLIDTVVWGVNNYALERNNVLNVGLVWGPGWFSFGKADGSSYTDIYNMNSYPQGELVTVGRIRAGTTLAGPDVYADNTMYVGGILTVNGSTNTNGLNTSSLQVGAAGAPADRQIRTYDLTATNNINVLNTFFYKSVAQNMNPASERRLKNHIEYIEDATSYLSGLYAARYTWKDPERFDDARHVAVYVDEMEALDPDTVQHPSLLIEHDVSEEEERHIRDGSGIMPEPQALVAYLVRGWQQHEEKIAELERRLSDAA